MNGKRKVSDSIWEDIIEKLKQAYERCSDQEAKTDIVSAGEDIDIIQSAILGKRTCKPAGGTIPGA